jgi:hypothetical protein
MTDSVATVTIGLPLEALLKNYPTLCLAAVTLIAAGCNYGSRTMPQWQTEFLLASLVLATVGVVLGARHLKSVRR